MIIVRVISSMIFVKRFGLYDSILFGLSLSMPLTLLVAVATLAYNAGNIAKELYFAFIIASIFEVILSMILIKFTNYLIIRNNVLFQHLDNYIKTRHNILYYADFAKVTAALTLCNITKKHL